MDHSICRICNQYFPNITELSKHQIIHCEIKLIRLITYICQNCNLTFPNVAEYELHFLKHMETKGKLPCSQCNRIFHFKHHLKDHLLRHFQIKNYSCGICENKFINNSGLQGHLSTHLNEDSYKCSKCNKKFSKKSYLTAHQPTHVTQKNFECVKCNKLYKSRRSLLNHVRLVHVKETGTLFKCTEADCKKSFKNLNYVKTHVNKCHKIELHKQICQFCSKKFYYKTQLIEHLKIHTAEKPFKCPQCDSCFSRKVFVKDHILQYHQGGLRPFKCTHPNCGVTFAVKFRFDNHMRRHTQPKQFKCSQCPQAYFERNPCQKHERTVHGGEKPYLCKECNKAFTNSDYLRIHMRSHSGEKPYPCKFDDCDKTFVSSSRLASHIKHRHTSKSELRVYQCNYCENNYTSFTVLRRHVNYKHTKEEQYPCAMCQKVFYVNGALTRHIIRIHTGEKPFPCKFDGCGKLFSDSSKLAYHTKFFHSETDQRFYHCKHCDKKYRDNRTLQIHVNSIHTKEQKFPCIFCPKIFYQRPCLNKHLAIHTGEKPYQCEICEKYFSSKKGLREHMNVHKGIKPFKCTDCESEFSHDVSLRRHKEKHHPSS